MMGCFDSLGNLFEGQGFGACDSHSRRDHFCRERSRSASGMPTHQSDKATPFPRVPPVVERLMTDTQFLGNRRGVLSGTQHQQTRRPRAGISPRMVDRQLGQRFGFAFAQGQSNLHRAPLVVDCSTTQKQISNQFYRVTYKWSELQRRHLDSTAKACGIEAAGKAIIENVLVMTPKVIEGVSASLPRAYPESVANAILNGLRSTAQRLGSVE